jgi:hypothetical protein
MGSLEDEIAAQDALKSADAAQRSAATQVRLDAITECAREFAVAARKLDLQTQTYEGTKLPGWSVHLGSMDTYGTSIAVFTDSSWRPIESVLKKRFFGRESYVGAVAEKFPVDSFFDNPNTIRASFASELRKLRDTK